MYAIKQILSKKAAVSLILLLLPVLFSVNGCGSGNTVSDTGREDFMRQNEKTAAEKAYVIILAGQSNASGMSEIKALKSNTSAGRFSAYQKGYKNVLISYCVDNQNISPEFVPVALGQGSTRERFGPEVGIAEYLTENCPSEKFFIIKASLGGSCLATDWQESSDVYRQMIAAIKTGFDGLTDSSYKPEWFATCWMQGETDSVNSAYAESYGDSEADLMERLENRFSEYVPEDGVSVIDAGISNFIGWTFSNKINENKKEYVSQNPANFYLDTSSLTYDRDNDDYCHYDSLAMIKLGEMFGEKIRDAAAAHGYMR